MQKIAVIGLGYAGLPLAVEFAQKGFSVIGIDTDEKKVNSIKKKTSYIDDVSAKDLRKVNLKATTDYSALKNVDAIIICVPTPLRKTKEPDISYVINSVKHIEKYLGNQQLVILESTTYPGTTEELILPILSRSGKKIGKDFFLAYSPERVDPGNKKYPIAKIPKVVAGVTPKSLKLISDLYRKVFQQVVPVSSTKVAETIKLLENTFRTVNIALVDEISIMCHRLGIDAWEVIRGAATKPFGFMPFYPGPGLGGVCLRKDPLYLAWRAKKHNYQCRFISLASDITTSMPGYIVTRLEGLVSLKGAKILVFGVAYKKDIADTRDSPSLKIIKLLQKKGADIVYSDPYVPQITVTGKCYRSVKISVSLLKKLDLVLIATDHSDCDYDKIIKNSRLIFDTRGITKKNANVVRL